MIEERELFPGQEDGTYFTQSLYDYAADNSTDPNILFKIKIKGYYQKLYKWTDEETNQFIKNNLDESIKWTDGIHEYCYDWGYGKNLITDHSFHFPNLDHIVPKSLADTLGWTTEQINHYSNFRIRCAKLNESKGNINSDQERRMVILDNWNDMILENKQKLLEVLAKSLDH